MSKICFWHFPRVYGSSLITVLDQNECFYNLGHVLWNEIPRKDWVGGIIALLREPVARAISQYQYWLERHPGADLIDDWLYGSPHSDPHRIRNNTMTGYISGSLEPNSYNLINAIKTLEKDIKFGISEYFNDSLAYFQKCYPELEIINYDGNIHNASRSVAISQKELEAIREMNKYDIELYARALELWNKRRNK